MKKMFSFFSANHVDVAKAGSRNVSRQRKIRGETKYSFLGTKTVTVIL